MYLQIRDKIQWQLCNVIYPIMVPRLKSHSLCRKLSALWNFYEYFQVDCSDELFPLIYLHDFKHSNILAVRSHNIMWQTLDVSIWSMLTVPSPALIARGTHFPIFIVKDWSLLEIWRLYKQYLNKRINIGYSFKI